MSRLDEALRRSRAPSSSPSLSEKRQGEVFNSPWSVGHDGTAAAVAATAAAPVLDEPASRAAHSRLVVTSHPDGLDSKWKDWLISPDADRSVVEQFRKLAAALFHAQQDGRLKVIMVTSAAAGEGKTMTALNLAHVLAESYRRSVLLIDADLRRPRLSQASGLTVGAGLGEALRAGDEQKVAVTQLTEHLTLMTAGRPDPEPLSALTSPRMQQLLDEGAERFDWVIIDTPPIGAVPDAGLLVSKVDGAVLVVRAGHTPHESVRHAIDTLGRDHIVGVVLNGVEQKELDVYGDYSDDRGTR